MSWKQSLYNEPFSVELCSHEDWKFKNEQQSSFGVYSSSFVPFSDLDLCKSKSSWHYFDKWKILSDNQIAIKAFDYTQFPQGLGGKCFRNLSQQCALWLSDRTLRTVQTNWPEKVQTPEPTCGITRSTAYSRNGPERNIVVNGKTTLDKHRPKDLW